MPLQILVAENDPATMQTTVEALEEKFQVILAKNPDEARNALKSHPVLAAILMDGRLEQDSDQKDRSGWDLANELQRTGLVPIIMYSQFDHANTGSVSHVPRITYVQKEVAPDELVKKILEEIHLNSSWKDDSDPTTKLLYKEDREAEIVPKCTPDLITIDDEMIRYFQKHPSELYTLNPRRFEELIAAILKDIGYSVELTALGADGGIDIFATQKTGIGEVLLIVDCKRYSPEHHVGVGVVRALYGIGEQMRATMAMLATTSFFTKSAKVFQSAVKNRLSLKDYNELIQWLNSYGHLQSNRVR